MVKYKYIWYCVYFDASTFAYVKKKYDFILTNCVFILCGAATVAKVQDLRVLCQPLQISVGAKRLSDAFTLFFLPLIR